MNEPVLNQQAPASQTPEPQILDPQNLNLRDIHLPDPISWWPIAPGWWIVLASLILVTAAIIVSRKIYRSRQLRRDIKAELESIKQQFQQSQNKVQLAKALSILLRRASISYYPKADTAGIIGNDWLSYLDATNSASPAGKKFNSDIGKTLLSAPYLPDHADLEFDAQALIQLCETWLRATHKSRRNRTSAATLTQTREMPS